MARLFIFGIGGSGTRVLRSLTFLLASGVDIEDYEIYPIIIDPDERNGDKMRTIQLLQNYQKIYEYIKNAKDKDEKNHFFYNRIVPVSEVFKEEVEQTEKQSDFEILLEDIEESFENYLNLNEDLAKSFFQTLYSKTNLDLKMNVGFKGNPHIGSIVLNQAYKHKRFKEFVNKFQTGDRIFLINSIFGGTGAAGFPLLLKIFRDKNYTDFTTKNTENAIIGGLTLLPYFKLKLNENSIIDSKYFISRIIPSLEYYNKNLKNINIHYFLGDPDLYAIYENFDGDKDQKNPAHIVEFLGALAILDFISKRDEELKSYEVYQFQLPEQQIYNFNHFPDDILNKIEKNLSKFFLFYWSLNKIKEKKFQNQPFIIDTNLEKFLKENIYSGTLIQFLKEFAIWLEELSNNLPNLKLFDLKVSEDRLDQFINNKIPKKRGVFSKKNIDLLLDCLNEKSKTNKKDYQKTDKKHFIHFLNKVFFEATEEYYNQTF